MATYFNAILPETRQKIRELEIKVGEERESLSNSELLEDMYGWVPSPGHTREGVNNI